MTIEVEFDDPARPPSLDELLKQLVVAVTAHDSAYRHMVKMESEGAGQYERAKSLWWSEKLAMEDIQCALMEFMGEDG